MSATSRPHGLCDYFRRYDVNFDSAPLNEGTLQISLNLVTKSQAYAKVFPVDAAGNYVCPRTPAGLLPTTLCQGLFQGFRLYGDAA